MRTPTTHRCWLLAALTAYLLTTASAFAIAPLVNATLEPRQISIGETAQLTITSTGNGMDAVTLPVVSGLEFRVVGQSRRMEIINGATLSTTSITVRITPQVAGIFTIPGITPKSQPLVLRVSPDTGGANSSAYGGSVPRPPLAAGGTMVNGIKLSADGAAFIRMNLPKRDVYVGESIPIDIEVGLRAGFVTSLNGLPTLTGTDFTLNNLSRKPERVEKLIDGQPFTVLTWHSVLAPVKPGSFPLAVTMPLTVRVRTRPQKDATIDDLLGDPFLQNFFGATVQKEVTVSSPPGDLKVLALPTDGRPRDFSGAVGTFKIASDLSSKTAAVGDPLTLRMRVSGTGNFDRVDSPMLEHVDQWKTYPPKSTFAQSDTVGFKGEKTFEQPLIASQPGAQTLPALTFSYFDPATHSYEILRSTPPAVTISPALADVTPPGAETTAGATSLPNKFGNDLRPDQAVSGQSAGSLVPLYLRSRFLALPSLLAILFAGGLLQMRRADTGLRGKRPSGRLPKEAALTIKQMDQAAAAGDAARFFRCARAALQKDLATRWQLPPQDISAAEIEERLGGPGEALRQIFILADETNYAGNQGTSTDFTGWTHVVRTQLTREQAS
jgi:hypothetical protein